MTVATIDVRDPALWADPHGALARARAEGPVARTADGQPMLLRYADVDAALRHPELATFSVPSLLDHNGIADGPLREWCDLLMLSLEGDDHARLRGLVSRAFTPRRVETARAGARAFVRDLLSASDGRLDWVGDVAHELPVWIVCEMLGVPSDDRHLFKEWTVDLALTFANVVTPDERARAEHALTSLYDYVRTLVASRRASPTFSTMRVAWSAPVTIGPVTLAPGEPVHLSLLAANRDPDRFERADVLDVGRTDVRHVSFGYGVHHCIGAALARLELQEALTELATSCRSIALEIDAPVWVPYLQVRRVESLPITYTRVA
jgi:cytochrome P450